MHWIIKTKNNSKTYVSNRVEKIQKSNIQILFTPGKPNPSDLCNKPKPYKEYTNNSFWNTGPSYIKQSDDSFIEEYKMEKVLKSKLPEKESVNYKNELKNIIPININAMSVKVKDPEGIHGVLHRYSNYPTLFNVIDQYFRLIFLMTKT